MSATVRLQQEPFDAAAEAAKLTRGRTDIGAVVSFTGICRGHEDGEPIAALTLEHYPGMAAAEFLMDYLKTRAPFWKRVEHAGGATWVDAKSSDDAAADRWTKPPARRA